MLLGAGSGLALLIGEKDWPGTAGVCLISIAFAIAVARRRLSRMESGNIPDFLTLFLSFQILNKLLTVASLAAGESQLTVFEASLLVETRFKFAAEWVHLAAMVFFTAGWILVERVSGGLRRGRRVYTVRFLLPFYGVTTILALLMQRAPLGVEAGYLSTIMQFSALATVGALLASRPDWGKGVGRLALTIAMLVPPTYLALTSGTKGALVVAALPLFVAALANGATRAFMVLVPFAIFMLGVGIPLSEEMRKANWESYGAREGISIEEGLARVLAQYESAGIAATLEHTIVRFAHRASSAQIGGVVMQVAEEDGLIGLEPIKLLPTIFIPRFLWPGKPLFQPGAWFTWYLGRAASPEDATSATATMLGTETYWMLGTLGLVLLISLGALYAAIWRALEALSTRTLMGIAGMYALLGSAVRFEESHVVYAVSMPIITFIYVWVLSTVERLGRGIFHPKERRR